MTEEIKIRGVEPHVKVALSRLASASHYPSLNSYLVHLLEKIVEQDGLTDYERLVKERHLEIAQYIEKNTEVLVKVLEHLD